MLSTISCGADSFVGVAYGHPAILAGAYLIGQEGLITKCLKRQLRPNSSSRLLESRFGVVGLIGRVAVFWFTEAKSVCKRKAASGSECRDKPKAT
ncbi:hypothetical protein HD806DRAFT_371174 [Xylariaceae sp. AK1471]|nr:hypothetical protein HD806DRAFT_371174 [Xylariaceae sp. AK1471]